MTQNEKRTATPRLRLPEFRNDPPWPETPLNVVLFEHGEKNDGKSEVHSVSVHKGVVNQVEHLGRSFAAADRSNYNLAKPHDIIYTKSPTGDFPYGIVKQNQLPYNVIVSPLYGVFSPINRHLGYLLDAYFESPFRTNAYLAPIIQKGAKNTIQISNARFLSKGLYLPQSEAEHKKIAECLSTLDELIEAESRKLDALKDHKTGLMQQLFPREGETRPRLRFPEFRDAPEWEQRRLGDLVEIATGQVDPKEPPYCDLPQIGSENIESNTGKIVNVKTAREKGVISGNYVFDKEDVLYSKIRPALNKVAAPSFKGVCSADIYPVRPNSGSLLRNYLVFLLLSEKFLGYAIRSSDRGKIPKINREALLSYEAHVPSVDEQRRIADCLSSLDDLIAAQSEKLESLRTHKYGLMQQLFPNPSEFES